MGILLVSIRLRNTVRDDEIVLPHEMWLLIMGELLRRDFECPYRPIKYIFAGDGTKALFASTFRGTTPVEPPEVGWPVLHGANVNDDNDDDIGNAEGGAG